ncbi:DUF637 domain-containing protein [Acinetobacter sp. V91_7]|uniref:DUF637 domain-containing protein n=1 Tax=unclassified Acinetobacter TaxID=196816 RepID=UPI00287DB380|nr:MULTISPECIES: DUF637 domain-containing protein [unclassified Acinetobacter]MDS7930458.1 DUF637 domain-containing protein [Acinetobacter sp. V102_4]MDS7932858.1 DUF637 domain-containing protein [Acinetobacter sp. V91_4B]MDS7961883.1 DUF637 domain-containing protein [Acinetobacter sp. V91_7]MDS8028953.1 DUF637 domain-containing protein [Acinetobacter sp. V91_13]
MNKQFYRTKFNAKLGTYVAVSELAKSHQGDTSPHIKASINTEVTDSSIAATGQRTLKQLVLALSSLMAISPIYANVVVNNGAAVAHKATVLKEGKVANVWITAPSALGVSRNSYTQFDVNQNGVILNNSRGAATSQITKTSIAANPNLAKGAATTIVNEVVSTNPSLLQGNLEVLGSRANVVIANPTGITVNGGGFINANQVTLSTGMLGYNSDGSIKQHTVKQGAITINPGANNRGLGGNANNPVALELLGRSIAINAPVNATTITAVTGANTITADTGEFAATTGTGMKPTVAIDVAQLGGLYANSIYLYANEAGIGVNNAGIIKAKNNLVLNSNGKITNTTTGLIQTTDASNGLMSVQTNRTDGHGDIINQGKIQSSNAVFVDAGRHLYLQQDSYTGVTNITSKNIVSLNTKGSVVGTGAVIKQFGDGQNVYINADGDISLTGKQVSGAQNNIGSNGGVYLSAGQKIKVTDASISARNDLGLSSNKQLDLKDSNLYSTNNGIYLNSVGTDIANAAINVTNAVLDAKTKLAIQSSGLLNLTALSLPIVSGQTSTRVQDVVFTAQQNLNFNQNKQMLQPIKGKLSIAAGGDISLATGLTAANVEVKGFGGIDIEGSNVKTKNITLSTAGNLNIVAKKDVNLQDNTRLWSSLGNINVSALGGNLTTTSLTALANKGKVSLLADKDVRLNIAKINSAVEGTTALDQTNQKSKITAGQDINIGSTNQGALYLYAGDIQSTAGNINLIADKNINLYRAGDVKQVKNADGTFIPKTTYLWSNLKAKDISVKSAIGNVELQWLNANASNDLVVDAKGFNRIYGGELKSGRNIELHGGDNVRLWAVNSNSGAHTAVSSDKNTYLNSDIDAKGQTSWAAASTVNMTAGGLLSLKSKGLQAHQRTNLKGGVVNIEAGTSLDWKDKYTLTAVDSAILKNNADLAQFNGDIGIQTGTGNLTITPTNITLNAYGDIDLHAKGGDLTLVGTGGTTGNGSEQVVKLNTTTGGISLAGQNVTLQGSELKASKDINLVATTGDVIVDGVKNTIQDSTKIASFERLKAAQLEKEVLLRQHEQMRQDKDYLFLIDSYAKNRGIGLKHEGEVDVKKMYAIKDALEEKYFVKIFIDYSPANGYRGSVYFIHAYEKYTPRIASADQLINFYSKNVNGYEHQGTNLISGNGNINLIAAKGVSISGSEVDAQNGTVRIEGAGTLAGAAHKIQGQYTSDKPSSVKQGPIKGSIIIDGLQDSYEIGRVEHENYNWRSPVNITTINGNKGVKIKATGRSETDNLILQGTEITSQNGNVDIEAYKNIIFDVAIENGYDKSKKTETKRKWYGKKKTTTTVKTAEKSGGVSVDIEAKNINIKSQEKNTDKMMGQNRTSIDMYSSHLTANGGKISIQAGGDLNFLTAKNETLNTTDISKKSSFIGIKLNNSKTTNTRNIKSELPAVLNADYIGTKSGFDTRLKGTVFNYLEGANIQAGGTISLEKASEIVTNTSTKKSNSVVWQSMQDKGSITETAKLPSFNGPIEPTFIAKGGLTVQVPVVSGKNNDVRAEVIKLSNQPGNEYLKTLIARKDVNWEAVKLAQENWDYKSQGLTGAGAAIIVIIVTVLTSGAGTAAASSVASATGSAALGASAQAAVATLASQASVSLINNGGDVGKTLKDLGSKESVRNLAVSMVTAGLLKEVGTALKLKPDSTYFPDRLMNNFTNAVGSTLVQTAINGGNLQDNLEKALLAGLSGALQGELALGIGDFLDFSNPDIWEYTIHKIAHAAAGCAAAAATKASCEAGAIGAGVGEIVAGLMPDPVNGDEYTVEEKLRNRNAGKIAAGVLSGYAGYDVNTAANAADIAIENNNNTRGGPKRSLFTYLAKKAVNHIAPEKSADPKVVANFWLRRTDKNALKQIDIDHIAQGHITTNKNGVTAVGFHHEPSGGVTSRVTQVVSKPDSNGVWEGVIEVYDANSKKWIPKAGNNGKSTFLPSGWTKEQMEFELTSVFKAGEAKGFVKAKKIFEAISPSGVKIKFVPPTKNVPQWRAWPVK